MVPKKIWNLGYFCFHLLSAFYEVNASKFNRPSIHLHFLKIYYSTHCDNVQLWSWRSSYVFNWYSAIYTSLCIVVKMVFFQLLHNKLSKLCFSISLFNNKTIILLNLAEYCKHLMLSTRPTTSSAIFLAIMFAGRIIVKYVFKASVRAELLISSLHSPGKQLCGICFGI